MASVIVKWRDVRPGDLVMDYGEPVYVILSAPRRVRASEEWTVKVRLGRTGPTAVRAFVGHMTMEIQRQEKVTT